MKRLSFLLSIFLSLVVGVAAMDRSPPESFEKVYADLGREGAALSVSSPASPSTPVRFTPVNFDDAVALGLNRNPSFHTCGRLLGPGSRVLGEGIPGANSGAIYRAHSPSFGEEQIVKYGPHQLSEQGFIMVAAAVQTKVLGAHGRETPTGIVPHTVYHYNDNAVEVMPAAPGKSLMIIVDEATSVQDVEPAFFDAGFILGKFHQAGMVKSTWGVNLALWRSCHVHGDFHMGNGFYDVAQRKFKLIDNADIIKALGQPETPFFDVMYFVFVSLFYHKYIGCSQLRFELFTSGLNAFLNGYIISFTENYQPSVREHLAHLIELCFDTALAKFDGRVGVFTSFVEILKRNGFAEDIRLIFQQCFEKLFRLGNNSSKVNALKNRLELLKRGMLFSIRNSQLPDRLRALLVRNSPVAVSAAAAAAALAESPVNIDAVPDVVIISPRGGVVQPVPRRANIQAPQVPVEAGVPGQVPDAERQTHSLIDEPHFAPAALAVTSNSSNDSGSVLGDVAQSSGDSDSAGLGHVVGDADVAGDYGAVRVTAEYDASNSGSIGLQAVVRPQPHSSDARHSVVGQSPVAEVQQPDTSIAQSGASVAEAPQPLTPMVQPTAPVAVIPAQTAVVDAGVDERESKRDDGSTCSCAIQ